MLEVEDLNLGRLCFYIALAFGVLNEEGTIWMEGYVFWV